MGARGLKRLLQASEILREGGCDPSLVPTEGPATAGSIAARAIAGGAELILAAGGDGTISEAAQGVAFTSVPMGILPAGTANVLASEIGLPCSMVNAAASLRNCIPTRISMGRLHCANGVERVRLFMLMAGVGLDAQIVYNLSLPLKSRLGKAAYWVAGFSLLGRELNEFEIVIDGRQFTCSFALISKVRNYGGDLEIARNTNLLDDRFEIVLFEGRSSLRYLNYLTRVALRRLNGVKGVTAIRSGGACLSSTGDRRIYIQVDGEYIGHLPARVEILPDALTLLVPETYLRRFGNSGRDSRRS